MAFTWTLHFAKLAPQVALFVLEMIVKTVTQGTSSKILAVFFVISWLLAVFFVIAKIVSNAKQDFLCSKLEESKYVLPAK